MARNVKWVAVAGLLVVGLLPVGESRASLTPATPENTMPASIIPGPITVSESPVIPGDTIPASHMPRPMYGPRPLGPPSL
jgi:hypothetical protein